MGPASSKKNTLRAMMRAGMDIARFNFSHGSHEEHRGRVDMVKNLREELNIPVALLLDTKGPEIRTKLLKDHKKKDYNSWFDSRQCYILDLCPASRSINRCCFVK